MYFVSMYCSLIYKNGEGANKMSFLKSHTLTKKWTAYAIVLLLFLQILIPCAMHASAATDYVVIVSGSSVNVRSGAGASNGQVGVAYLGTAYDYIDEAKDSSGTKWYKIQYSSSSAGWITSKYSLKTKRAEDYTQVFIDHVAASYDAVGVQVAVIEDGIVTDTYNYGWATKGTDPMTSEHKIRVASISKVAVAINAMKMQEQGVVDINTNIGNYWGANPYKAITLKSLLTHTSTLKPLSYSSTREGTLSQLTSSGSYNSGTVGNSSTWGYNNYAAGVAGSTLEVASGQVLDSYAKENVFGPLGMDAAFSSGLLNDTSKLATLYHSNGNVARSVLTAANLKGRTIPGCNTNVFAGGLTCSAQDLAKLMAMLANDGTYDSVQVLTPASVSAIESRLFTKSEYGGSFYQCMPLRYKAGLYGESGLYYHTGNAYGVLALASYNPDTRDGVVVLTTGMSDYNTVPACSRDAQGIYEICSKLTEYVYKYHNSSSSAEATTTTSTSTTTIATTTMSTASTTNTSTSTTVTTSTVPTTSPSEPDISLNMLGASIRVSDPYGIRFGIQFDKNEFYQTADIVEYGTLIIGSGTLGGAELTLETPSIRRIKAENILSEDDSKIVYNGVLINIPESFFDTNVTARGYVIYRDSNGNECVAYTVTATKNFRSVAQAAYDKYSAIVNPSAAEQAIIEKLAGIISR